MARSSAGIESSFALLKRISNCSEDWWNDCNIHTLDTSGKPNRRSEEALLNSAASNRPRSIAGTISPPGIALTETPMSLKISIERPTVRYLRPFMSSTLTTGFLNQPKGCVGIGPYRNEVTLMFNDL